MSRTRHPREPGHLTPRERQALGCCDCPDGMSVQDLQAAMGLAFQSAHEFLTDLVRFGHATRVKAPNVRSKRFFAQAVHAAAWLDGHLGADRAAKAQAAADRAGRAEKVQAQAQDRAVALKPKKAFEIKATAIPRGVDGDTVMPKRTDIPARAASVATNPNGIEPTRVATPIDSRYFVAPGEPLTGGFSACRPGVDPMSGRAWGAAA